MTPALRMSAGSLSASGAEADGEPVPVLLPLSVWSPQPVSSSARDRDGTDHGEPGVRGGRTTRGAYGHRGSSD